MSKSLHSLKSAIGIIVLMGSCAALSGTPSTGHVSGEVRDAAGNPLPDLLISLVARSAREALPVLTRTDAAGRVLFRNVRAGIYELAVTSSLYETPRGRLVEIEPGETVSVKLVLQQLLTLGGDQDNVGIKTLLRSANGRRMIFRSAPQVTEDTGYFFEKAALQVVTDTGLGEDSFGFPGSDLTGTTTTFALQDSLLGSGDYLVAGQIHSGTNSSWRIKNILDYPLATNHSLRFFFGYGRISLGQANYPESGLSNQPEGLEPASAARVLSAGLEDRWNIGESLSFLVGLELNQVRNQQTRSFVSPSAEIDFKPLRGTSVQLRLASKRRSRASSVPLPDGEVVSLSDAVFFSPLDDRISFGTTRYLEAKVVQSLGAKTSLEAAAFQSRILGAPVPILAIWQDGSGSEVLSLMDDLAGGGGYRLALTREITSNVRARVSYVRAEAAGLASPMHDLGIRADIGLEGLVEQRFYHGVSTEVEAFIPASKTRVTALVKTISGQGPLLPLDVLSDFQETSNQGLNFFVRQMVPVPETLLGFLGLDFLSAYQLEILLDIRNLTNEEVGLLESGRGNLVLMPRPRTVRGGISVKF